MFDQLIRNDELSITTVFMKGGKMSLTVYTGPAGVGKTETMQMYLEAAEHGHSIGAGVNYASTRSLQLGLIRAADDGYQVIGIDDCTEEQVLDMAHFLRSGQAGDYDDLEVHMVRQA